MFFSKKKFSDSENCTSSMKDDVFLADNKWKQDARVFMSVGELDIKENEYPISIFGINLTLKGDVESSGEIKVEGTIEGNVHAKTLIVEEKAVIKGGKITGDTIVIRGHVVGDIKGNKITLDSACRVEGTITHETLTVVPGAFFEGSCHHATKPLSQEKKNQQIVDHFPSKTNNEKSSIKKSEAQ